jgi:hypothetical protein
MHVKQERRKSPLEPALAEIARDADRHRIDWPSVTANRRSSSAAAKRFRLARSRSTLGILA